MEMQIIKSYSDFFSCFENEPEFLFLVCEDKCSTSVLQHPKTRL